MVANVTRNKCQLHYSRHFGKGPPSDAPNRAVASQSAFHGTPLESRRFGGPCLAGTPGQHSGNTTSYRCANCTQSP